MALAARAALVHAPRAERPLVGDLSSTAQRFTRHAINAAARRDALKRLVAVIAIYTAVVCAAAGDGWSSDAVDLPAMRSAAIADLICAGDFAAAAAQLQRRDAGRPDDAAALFMRAWLARFFGDLTRAGQILDQLVALQPSAPIRDACTREIVNRDWLTLAAQLRNGSADIPLPLADDGPPQPPNQGPAAVGTGNSVESVWTSARILKPAISGQAEVASRHAVLVQLGTLRSEASVEPLIERALRAAPDLLDRQNLELLRSGGSKQLIIIRFRVRDGERTCALLTQAKLDCLVVPGRQAG
ncbi:MAG: hypothetical protein FJX35_11610 [Alphaproteobacteria bacterium]|nr:hypothetical protein [Alphaproteobacteria bacterium]